MPLHPTTAYIHDLVRRQVWRDILGHEDGVPVVSPVPVLATTAAAGVKRFYRVDIKRLTPEQLERAIDYLAAKFGEPREEVAAGVRGEIGIPLLADDVHVAFDARLVL